ncbi:MAG: proline dehydrogenase family protein, partial [Actinomycetota bacterium]
GYEIQMLYGMGEPIQAAVRQMGLRLRVYTPVGSLVPGMAYLVRRLLENTSNESFLRHRFAEGQALEELIGPPAAKPLTDASPPEPRPATDASSPGSYDPEPVAEWRNAGVRRSFAGAVRRASAAPAAKVPALIGGHDVSTPAVIPSVDPGNPSREIARSACCGAPEGDDALDVALKAWEKWRRTAPERRASVLFAAAQWMRVRRNDLAALEVFEAAKPWREADADVCEAIDFCEYYGRRMLVLAEGGDTQSPAGESNELIYQSRGVGLVISPWNFPLAIPTGMVCAALVCGNAVLFKPSEQTPLVGRQLVDALIAGGLPEGVLSFLPGHGEEVGAHLVRRPEVSFIAFTGSKAVGLGIVKTAAEHSDGQRHVKRVIAEMGGKNALIIDSDADPDQAVPGAVYSAFGYAGQKCSAASRLIIVEPLYDEILERLVGAGGEVIVGHACEMGTTVGPLIDAGAQERVLGYIGLAGEEGTLALHRTDIPETGYFAPPTIVTDLPASSRVAREEIFGPVLSVFRAANFEEAVALANDTEYALTAGVYSRSIANVRYASRELRGGNVYINRPTTGAVVGRQPFGGYGLSGVGSKAGGPDYLLQFVDPRAVSENTLRQGFAPSQLR